ncbi:MAG: TonB-dependent receptor [Bacteroidetes bacterium]|nr:TonB-dependent receptor [Bacteroidota bacterium]
MLKKFVSSSLCFLLFPSVFLVLNLQIAKSQYHEFDFNTKGNVCYFQYLKYAPNIEYSSIKRPFLFIMGAPNENVYQMFDKDTLRMQHQFSNYLFVYLPNRGGNTKEKLQCLDGLGSLLSYNYMYGHANFFFQIYDNEITESEIHSLGYDYLFKSVRINRINTGSILQDTTHISAMDAFKETVINYDPLPDDDDIGTFYHEEANNEGADEIKDNKPIKIYFGPPQKYNYMLNGMVYDKSSGEALPFATVLVKGTLIGASTNADGYFTIPRVPNDTSVLIVQYIGYERTEIYLTPFDLKQNFKIEISQNTQNLRQVIITAKKGDVVLAEKTEVNTIKMSPRKLEQIPNLGERDIMRSFQLMPGISAANESSSGLYVRGGTPDQNLVLYDGLTIYHVDHLYGFFSAFNSNAIKDVQLFKGGFESRFGGRLSSVTEITAKDGNQKKFNIGGDLSLLSMNMFVEIPVGEKFTSIITYRRSYKGPIYDKLFSKFNTSSVKTTFSGGGGPEGRFMEQTEATSYFYDLNGKFTYRPNNKDILSLSIFSGTDKLDNSSSIDASSFSSSAQNMGMNSTDLTKYGNFGTSFKWSRKCNAKLYGNTVLSYSNYFSERNRTQERTLTNSSGESVTTNDGILENNDLRDYSLRSDYQWDVLGFYQLQFGGFATHYDIKYTYAQSDTANILDRRNYSILAGVYMQTKVKLFKDKLQLIPGIRYSYYKTTLKPYFEPRTSLAYNITDKFTIKASTGKYYQFANRVTREDIMSGSKDFWVLSGEKSIPVSSSIHYTAGLAYETTDYLLSAETYYKKTDNLTEYSLRINANPMQVNIDENFYTGSGYSKGIELLVQKKEGKFNGWMSYTLGKAMNKFDVYSDTYFPANQDVNHEFKIVALYKYKRWDFSATWIYASGKPYTAPSGAYTITLLDGTTKDYFTVTSKNGVRLPAYNRCDISVNFKLLRGEKADKKRKEFGYIGFSIFNLYNQTNVWYKQFSIVDSKILETNVNYLGITPNITLSLKLR